MQQSPSWLPIQDIKNCTNMNGIRYQKVLVYMYTILAAACFPSNQLIFTRESSTFQCLPVF